MQLMVRPYLFSVAVDGRNVKVADTPRLRFVLPKLPIDPATGELGKLEFPQPRYENAQDLLDSPISGARLPRPIPLYPSELRSAVGAWILSSKDLRLDIWVEVSRAFMTHLCKEPPAPGAKKRVKPLYKFKAGVGLSFGVKADKELWKRGPKPGGQPHQLGDWELDKVEPGEWLKKYLGVSWGDEETANGAIESTPCVDLPAGEPRDTWTVLRHEVVRTLSLPYLPGTPIAVVQPVEGVNPIEA